MENRKKTPFDPKQFLAKIGEGKTILKYRKNQIIFSQGEVAEAVFYIQEGQVKLTVVSEQGKEAVVGIVGSRPFFWRRMPEWPSTAPRNNDGDR
jgi:CRP/FNR family transcriptional regulator, cyclic AMP receptor protein